MLKRDAALIISLSFFLAAFSLAYRRGKNERAVCRFGSAVFFVCVALFLALAVFTRPRGEYGVCLEPFLSYRKYVVGYYGVDVFAQIIENIVFFVPIGFFLPFVSGERHDGFLPAVLFGAALSALVELTQLAFSLGVFETDDFINNTMGAFVGIGLYRLMSAEKKTDRFSGRLFRRRVFGALPAVVICLGLCLTAAARRFL